MPTTTVPLQLNLQILGRITVPYIYHTSLFIDEQELATAASAIALAAVRLTF
ncbi:MAG: hypothetical protein V7L11_23450 [Nostoc sp.]|uniref:hypothetical protein n=1 Tax=Nostoc sp. TaxID=1180 RepID=UPI002FFC9E9F